MPFVDRVVGQMHILAKPGCFSVIVLASEASEAFVVDVDTKRVITSYADVYS